MEAMGSHERSGSDLVEVGFAESREQAELIQGLLHESGIPSLLRASLPDGPTVGIGLLPRTSQRILVSADRAEAARELLAETLVEAEPDGLEGTANASYLEGASGRKVRNYGIVGAYARALLVALAVFAVIFAVFLVLHGPK